MSPEKIHTIVIADGAICAILETENRACQPEKRLV